MLSKGEIMNNLPPFVYSKAFWEAATTVVASVLALLAFFGRIDPTWAVPAAVLLSWIFSLLRLFGIEPELRARALVEKLERLVYEQEARLANLYSESAKAKSAKKVNK